MPLSLPGGRVYMQLTNAGQNLVEFHVRNIIRDLINSPDVQRVMDADPARAHSSRS